MTPIGWSAIIISIVAGSLIGYMLYKRTPDILNRFLNKDYKKIKEVLTGSPHQVFLFLFLLP